MRRRVSLRRAVILSVVATLLFGGVWPASTWAQDSEGDRILGYWDDGSATIEVSKCEDKYCGKIVKLRKPEVDGKPAVDAKNEDKSLQSRPLMGLEVLTDYVYAGDDLWNDGMTYVSAKGKAYPATFTMVDQDKLEVRIKLGDAINTFNWPRTTLD